MLSNATNFSAETTLPTAIYLDLVSAAAHSRFVCWLLLMENDSDGSIPDNKGLRHVKDERISQVWFAGAHANVGGGYPDDSLANVSLDWMMKESARFGLQFKTGPKSDPDSLKQVKTRLDIDGRLYDSRRGFAGYYRYGPRDVLTLYPASERGTELLPKIHYTVFERMMRQVHPYAPIGLPACYAVVDDENTILEKNNPYESLIQAKLRSEHQNIVWNFVFRRSLAYLAVVSLSLAFFLFPFVHHSPAVAERSTHLRPVSDLIRIVAAFLPSGLDFWVSSYARNPAIFLAGVFLLICSQRFNSKLKIRIFDEMRAIWIKSLRGGLSPPTRNLLFVLRSSAAALLVRRTLLELLIPYIVMFAVFSWAVMFANHYLFNLADAAGFFCDRKTEDARTHRVPGDDWTDAGTFDTQNMCWDSGLWLQSDILYEIRIAQLDDWFDDTIPAGLGGFEPRDIHSRLKRAIVAFSFPMRRTLDRPFFSLIARIGAIGNEEDFLVPDSPHSRLLYDRIKPSRDGELFLYVNDAILAIPGLSDFFYRNNKGTAEVQVRQYHRQRGS
jgi:hypothetical protein